MVGLMKKQASKASRNDKSQATPVSAGDEPFSVEKIQLHPLTMATILILQKIQKGEAAAGGNSTLRDFMGTFFVVSNPIDDVRKLLSPAGKDGRFPNLDAAVEIMGGKIPFSALPELSAKLSKHLESSAGVSAS